MKSVLRDTTQNTCSCNPRVRVNVHITPTAFTAGALNLWQISHNVQNTPNFIYSPGKPESHQDLASIRKVKKIYFFKQWFGLQHDWPDTEKAASPFPMWAPRQHGPIPKRSSSYHLHKVHRGFSEALEKRFLLKIQHERGYKLCVLQKHDFSYD